MAYVDEIFVKKALEALGLPAHVALTAVEADDESVDAEVQVHLHGEEENKFAVQCGGGYLCLNEYGYARPGDTGSFYSRQWGRYGVQPDDLAKLHRELLALVGSA